MKLSKEVPESTCFSGVQGEERMDEETEKGQTRWTAERQQDSAKIPSIFSIKK